MSSKRNWSLKKQLCRDIERLEEMIVDLRLALDHSEARVRALTEEKEKWSRHEMRAEADVNDKNGG